MKPNSRIVAVGAAAVLLVACIVAGWALLSDRDSDPGGAPITVTVSPSGGGRPPQANVSPSGAHPGSSPGPGHPVPRATEPARSGPSAARPPSGSANRRSGSARPYRLAHDGQQLVSVRRGARVPLRTSPGGKVVKTLGARTPFGSPTVLALFARRGAWAGVPTPLLPDGRLGWVKLDRSRLRPGWTRYSIDVNVSSEVARLRLAGRDVRSFNVTVGAPASPTPTGRFAITDTFRGGLNPAYGCCALATSATQSNLPSGWLGGNRIAIHGTTGPVGGALSHGCIRGSDSDVGALVRRVGPGTPVVIHQ
ncbi:MAG: L,D-transpeptidase [Solirubrobacterales bacterium]